MQKLLKDRWREIETPVRQRDEPTGAGFWQRVVALALAEIWAMGDARAEFEIVIEYVSIYNRLHRFAENPEEKSRRYPRCNLPPDTSN
jgi:hypothetical protein